MYQLSTIRVKIIYALCLTFDLYTGSCAAAKVVPHGDIMKTQFHCVQYFLCFYLKQLNAADKQTFVSHIYVSVNV